MSLWLRDRRGATRALPLDTWVAPASASERELLAELRGPVLDLGCGPGRLVVALGELGIPALGIDTSPHAIGRATERGAHVLERSVFEELPGEGRWPCVLLFDGNIGIGGDPVALLDRVRRLLSRDGVMVVEVDPPGGTTRTATHVRLELDGERSDWFPWAWVAADGLDAIAAEAGVRRRRWRRVAGRWFAELEALPR